MLPTRVASTREPRSASHLKGWGFPVMGFLMLAMGVTFVVALTTGASVRPPDARPHLMVAGWAMAIGGLVFIAIGIHLALVVPRFRRRLRERPLEPWVADHAWDPGGARERPLMAILRRLMFALPAIAIGALLTGVLLSDVLPRSSAWHLLLGLILFLILLGLAREAVGVARSLKYGTAWLSFARFPYFLGETLEVRLGCGVPLDRFDRVTVTLRYIRERHVDSGDCRNAVAEAHWAQSLSFAGPALRGYGLPVSIPLPAGDFSTALSAQPPCYWEIEAKGAGRGLDFQTSFLVPVYARPARNG